MASALEAYLHDTLDRTANGHPIGRIDELMPWTQAVTQPGPVNVPT
jgi:hypothetical protein